MGGKEEEMNILAGWGKKVRKISTFYSKTAIQSLHWLKKLLQNGFYIFKNYKRKKFQRLKDEKFSNIRRWKIFKYLKMKRNLKFTGVH